MRREAPEVHQLTDEFHTLKEFTPTKEEFEQIEIQTKKIQETKIDRADIAQLMQASWTEGKPELLEDLEEKVEIIEDAMKYFMEETGISYQVPTIEEGTSEVVSMPKDYEPPEPLHIPSLEEELVEEITAPKIPKRTFQGVILESEGGDEEEEVKELEVKEVKKDKVKAKIIKPQKRPSVFKMKPPSSSETSFGNRIEQLAKEIARIGRKLDNREEQELTDKRLDALERLFQKLNEDQRELQTLLSELESVINAQMKKNEEFENKIVELEFNKTDRKELTDGLELKVNKSDMEGKVSTIQFESAIGDLGDTINTVLAIGAQERNRILLQVVEIQQELKLKLNTADFEELQYPLNNRIRALLYGFKKMREIIQSTVYPEAAAITKCMSCGRPSQLAGAKYKECGDTRAFPKYPHRRDYLVNDSKPPDDQGGSNKRKPDSDDDTATMSVPESFTTGNEQSQPSSALLCHKCSKSSLTPEEKNQSKNNSTIPELDDLDRSVNYNQGAFQLNIKGVGLSKPKPKSEIENELRKLCETSPKTRFCGGVHTKVQHKAYPAINMEFLRRTREKVTVLGYDKSYYHGTVAIHGNESSEQRHEVADHFTDLTDDELVTAFDEAFGALPQLHTNQNEEKCFVDVLDRALKFAPLRYTDDPVRRDSFNQDCKRIEDSGKKSLSIDRISQGPNISRKSKSDGQIGNQTLLRPAIITMSMDSLKGLSESIRKANQHVSEQLHSEQHLALNKMSDSSIKSGSINKQTGIKKK